MTRATTPLPHVCVLLSTFNGERFLVEQLDSLRAQQNVELTLLVRDDGSRDGTVQILREYASRWPAVRLAEGPNVGVVASYLDLLRSAAEIRADYCAFCDQDDFWLPDKLASAVQALGTDTKQPRLYCSAVRYVDADLRDIDVSRTRLRPAFENALVENIAVGCTTVFNRPALELVNGAPPRHALMHDWWLYLVVSSFGHVIFDPQPRILYRQHGNNVVGGTTSIFRMMLVRIRRLRLRRHGVFRCSDQAREFLELYGARCREDHRRLLEDMLAARPRLARRIQLAASGRLRRNHWLDDVLLRVLVICGLY